MSNAQAIDYKFVLSGHVEARKTHSLTSSNEKRCWVYLSICWLASECGLMSCRYHSTELNFRQSRLLRRFRCPWTTAPVIRQDQGFQSFSLFAMINIHKLDLCIVISLICYRNYEFYEWFSWYLCPIDLIDLKFVCVKVIYKMNSRQ